MRYTPEEVAKLLANRPNQPHYIASLIAECVAAERERCAKLCDHLSNDWHGHDGKYALEDAANKIRA
jgi:hypothetical protein